MKKAALRILLVEDSPSDADLLQEVLHHPGAESFAFTRVDRLEDALARLNEEPFDVLLLDLSLPDSIGPDTFRRAHHAAQRLPIVVLTGLDDERLGIQAVREGIQDYLVKGKADGRQIARTIRYAVERAQAQEELHQLTASMEQRTAELEAANEALRCSRLAALNVTEDAIEARKHAERVGNELSESEQRLQQALRVSHSFAFEWQPATDRVLRSSSCEAVLGLSGDEVCNDSGRRYFQRVHPDDRARFVEMLHGLTPAADTYTTEYRVVRGDDSTIMLQETGQATFDSVGKLQRLVGVATDISERKQREAEIQKLNRTLRAISGINQAVIRAKDESEYMKEACRVIVEVCDHKMAWIGLADEDQAKTVRPVAHHGFEEGYLKTLEITWADTARGRGPTGTAIRSGRPAICRNMLTDPDFAPWRAEALKRGYASSIVLPLMNRAKALGAISIYSSEPDPFSPEEVMLLAEMATDLARGIGAFRLRADHAQAEEALRESEERYRNLFNRMTEGFAIHEILCDSNGTPCDYRFLDINPAFETLTGLARDKVIGRTHNEIMPGDDPKWVSIYGTVALTGEMRHFENYSPALKRHFEVFAYRPAPRQFAVLFRDVTARREAEKAMEAALRDKSVLLQELYHRVKNNMHLIVSMLNLQSMRLADPAAARAFKETQDRILSMALVHEKLYRSGNLSQIDLKDYIAELLQILSRSHQGDHPAVAIVSSLETVQVSIDSAIPCGLVISELVTNALKHAFAGGRTGTITVLLRRMDGDGIELRVSDDGVGLPAGHDYRGGDTLGLQSVVALVEHQLSGRIEHVAGPGASFRIQFKDVQQKKRL